MPKVSQRYARWIRKNGLAVVTDWPTRCTKCGEWVPRGSNLRWWPSEYTDAKRRECCGQPTKH